MFAMSTNGRENCRTYSRKLAITPTPIQPRTAINPLITATSRKPRLLITFDSGIRYPDQVCARTPVSHSSSLSFSKSAIIRSARP